jgi:hypothetical protein
MYHYEEWLAFLSTHLPAPVRQEEATDGSLLFTGGEPPLVRARLTPSVITVYRFAVRWDAPDRPVVVPRRVGTLVWRRARNNEMLRAVGALIEAAREARLGTFTVCVICERPTPPERMHDDQICDSCARRESSAQRDRSG